MKAAVIAIVITVVGTLLSAYLVHRFRIGDDPPPDQVAEPRVVALSPFGNRIGTAPSATIEVENQGTITAENCVINWFPGMDVMVGILKVPAVVQSDAFALQPHESLTRTLQSTNVYVTGGTYDSTASVSCTNATSESVGRQIYVY